MVGPISCSASWCLDHSFPSEARICIAYHVLHIMPCFASCCLCITPWLIVGPLLVFLLWIEPGDGYVIEEPVEYAYEDQDNVNSENLAGKMTTPRNHFYLCYASCSLYCHAPLPITCYIMSPILSMSSSNHPFLANRCLAKLPLLLSPSYSVASCRWSWSCSMSEHGYVGISQYLLFN